MGIHTLLDSLHFTPRRGRDHDGEGGIQRAAVPQLGVMVLRGLLLLSACVRVAGLGRRTFGAAGAVGAAGTASGLHRSSIASFPG